MKNISRSLEDTEIIAREFVKKLEKREKAFVVGLYGDLGAGKTTFTQAVAKVLGVSETVNSPTFVIEKIYKLQGKKIEEKNGQENFEHLIHIDAYRLEKSSELMNLGWKEIVDNPNNIIFLEWPERVADILPEALEKIYFTFIDEKTREIIIS